MHEFDGTLTVTKVTTIYTTLSNKELQSKHKLTKLRPSKSRTVNTVNVGHLELSKQVAKQKGIHHYRSGLCIR